MNIRDQGPYSARNVANGAQIESVRQVFGALASGTPLSDIQRQITDGILLRQKTRGSRSRTWDSLWQRYFSHGVEWVREDLIAAYKKGPLSKEFLSLLYLHYAFRDSLTFDFVTQYIWARWSEKKLTVMTNDLVGFLDEAAKEQAQINGYSEATRIKLAHSILAALRDFGLLQGKRKKLIVRPDLPPDTADHVLRLLTTEGKQGLEILQDKIWRLFLCDQKEVAGKLQALAQQNRIEFERVGNTIILQTPSHWVQ